MLERDALKYNYFINFKYILWVHPRSLSLPTISLESILFRALLVVQLIQEIQKENKEQQVDEAGIAKVVK